MNILAIVSLISCLYIFVMGMFNAAVDPDKSLNQNFEITQLTDRNKRMRFVWFVIGVLPSLALSIAQLTKGEWSIVDYSVLGLILMLIAYVLDKLLRPMKPKE